MWPCTSLTTSCRESRPHSDEESPACVNPVLLSPKVNQHLDWSGTFLLMSRLNEATRNYVWTFRDLGGVEERFGKGHPCGWRLRSCQEVEALASVQQSLGALPGVSPTHPE